MEEHQKEIEVLEESVAVLEQWLSHFHLAERELGLLILTFACIEPVLFAFGIFTLSWWRDRFHHDIEVVLWWRHVDSKSLYHGKTESGYFAEAGIGQNDHNHAQQL